ncbi:family 43 glycosylhydrolase [Marinilongibacter aquaticus]|uniref:family 43 glycosylhydrolase n=1 Tax=Marinilongibacter aquaticus TaxID=2975157 RepID=UPI0021BDB873|nr:family 43 glycosylhydrolase [Marinilongibacter aquaticus]UBM60303.1 family 43 glycosylhydrolase [Marinilongibacter aquaticus]
MPIRFAKTSLFLSICFLLFGCAQKDDTNYNQEQVILGELPDPSIIEVNSKYYATGSSNNWGPLYPIYESDDMRNWTFVNYSFRTLPTWTMSSYWAPELFYRNGMFYLYYTARRNDGISCIGVATSTDLSQGFTDKGVLLEWGNEAIDAFVYEEAGTMYITWKAYGLNPNKPIQILGAALANDGLSLASDSFEIMTAESDSWEKGGMEGQCIVKKGNYLYMLYSGNACCGKDCDYQVGVARAKSIKGPWEKYEGNPILTGNASWKCPGHGTLIASKDRWHYLYHAYSTQGFPYLGRSALLSEMKWDEGSGWPVFEIEETKINPEILSQDIEDEFSADRLENWWLFDVPNYHFSAATSEGKLVLTDLDRDLYNESGTVLVTVPQKPDFEMSTQLAGQSNNLKGLVFYATPENSLGLGQKDKSLILWKVADGEFNILNEIALEKADSLHLKAKMTEAHIVEFQYSLDGTSWQPIPDTKAQSTHVVGDNLDWWSWGMKCGLFVKADSSSQSKRGEFKRFSLTYAHPEN